MANDVMMGFTGSLQNFLTEEQIKKQCPLAYATSPTNDKVSDKYVLANTATVIKDMEQLGWKVVNAKQRKAQKKSSGRFSYHMVAFQNPNISITKTINDGETVVDCYPQIILTNSHDGLNCFQFRVGLFRCICSNGLVICTDEMADVKIRHIYYSFEELRKTVTDAIQTVGIKVARMTEAAAVQLTEEAKRQFAIQALAIRKNVLPEEVKVDDETIVDLLDPIRQEDKGNSLWNVFNVLQEKLIKGGYKEASEEGKKARKVRKVTSFIKDIDINQKLWKTMESYIPVPAAA